MRIQTWTLALVLAAWVQTGTSRAAPLRVVVIGDSITDLVSAPSGPRYPRLLSASLGDSVELVDVSCSGTGVRDWVTTGIAGREFCGTRSLFDDRVLTQGPFDVAIVLLGTNDAIGFFQPPADPGEYRRTLMSLVARLVLEGEVSETMLLGPPDTNLPQDVVRTLDRYNFQRVDLCLNLDLHCGPDLRKHLGSEDFAPGDIHPNATGHRKIAEALELELSVLPQVPEPATWVLLAISLAGLAGTRRS